MAAIQMNSARLSSFRLRYRKTLDLLRVKRRVGFSSEQLSKTEQRFGIKLPKALREFYLLCGKHKINQTHNRLLSPDDMLLAGNRLVFMEENQNVVYWGISCNNTVIDPLVMQTMDLDDAAWNSERVRCSIFLCVMLCIQATGDPFGPVGFSDRMGLRVIRKMAKQWTFIGRVNELSAYAVDGLAVCVYREKKTAAIQVGSASKQGLLDFQARFGINLRLV